MEDHETCEDKNLSEIKNEKEFEIAKPSKELLDEESFDIIWNHLKRGMPFAIISVSNCNLFKNYQSEEINIIDVGNEKILKEIIRFTRFGYHAISGIQHKNGLKKTSLIVFTTYPQYSLDKPDEQVKIKSKWEKRLYEICMYVGKKFYQESVLFFGLDKVGVHL